MLFTALSYSIDIGLDIFTDFNKISVVSLNLVFFHRFFMDSQTNVFSHPF